MRRNILVKRLTGVFGAALLLLGLLPWAAEYLPAIAGVGCYGVHGGSMEPVLHDGDLVYAARTSPDGLEENDIAVFRDWLDDGKFIAHRVIDNIPEHGSVVTKGDANDAPDALPVPYGNIAGRMIASVPNGGRILTILTSGAGACASLLLASTGAMLLVMSWSVRIRRLEP